MILGSSRAAGFAYTGEGRVEDHGEPIQGVQHLDRRGRQLGPERRGSALTGDANGEDHRGEERPGDEPQPH